MLLLGAATTMTSTSIQTRCSRGRRRRSPQARLTRPDASIGEFWQISRYDGGQIIAWHNGQTTGYTAVLGLALQHHKAVVVCSDVARVADNLRNQLLA